MVKCTILWLNAFPDNGGGPPPLALEASSHEITYISKDTVGVIWGLMLNT